MRIRNVSNCLSLVFLWSIFTSHAQSFDYSKEVFDEVFQLKSPSSLVQDDNNLGTIRVSFSIPLPNTLEGLPNAIKLNYTPLVQHNFGLGYGFDWSFPELQRVSDNPRADWILKDDFGTAELIEKDNSLYELGLKSFVKIDKTSDGEFKATYPDGHWALFDSGGLLLELHGTFHANNMKLEWKENRLMRIDFSNGVEVTFKYSKADYTSSKILTHSLPFYSKGRTYNTGQLLREVVLSNTKINSTKAIVKFEYTIDGCLQEVFWSNHPELPLFQAEYGRFIGNSSDQMKVNKHERPDYIQGELVKNGVFLKEDLHRGRFMSIDNLYAQQGFGQVRLVGDEEGGSSGILIPTDINNNGMTDFVYLHRFRNKGRYSGDWPFRSFKRGSWSGFRGYVYLATKKNGLLVYEKNNAFTLPAQFEPFKPEEGPSGDYRSYLDVHSNVSIGDFDGNGYIDLALFGQKNLFALNNGKKFTIKAIGHKIHKNAKTIDLNHDGFTDIISNDKVMMASPNKVQVLNLNLDKIKKIQNQLKDIEFGLSDIDFDGLPEILNESSYELITDISNDGNLEYWKIGVSGYETKKIMPVIPIIKKVTNELGAYTAMTHDVLQGLPVIESKKSYSLAYGDSSHFRYHYSYPFHDLKTNKFLGFEIVKKDIQQTSHADGTTIVKKYYKDDLISTESKQRNKYHGLLTASYECKLGECQDLPFELIEDNSISTSRWIRSSIRDYQLLIVNDLVGYPKKADNQYFIYLDSEKKYLASERSSLSSGKAITTSEKRFYKNSNFSNYGPLLHRRTIEGHGISSVLSDAVYMDNYEEKKTAFEVLGNGIIKASTEVIGYDKDHVKKLVKKEQYKYEKTPGEEGFMVTHITGSDDTKITKTVHDENGRRAVFISHLADTLRYNYGYTEFPTEVNHRLFKERYKYDIFGNILSKKTLIEDTVYRELEYTRDAIGLIESIKVDDLEYTIHQDFIANKGVYRTLTTKDSPTTKELTIFYDGMGNQVDKVYKLDSLKYYSTGQSRYNAEGKLTLRSFPEMRGSIQPPTPSSSITYNYDALSRIKRINNSTDLAMINFERQSGKTTRSFDTFIFDVTERNFTGSPKFYNKGDLNGSFMTRNTSEPIKIGSFTYEYDLANRLINVQREDNKIFSKKILQPNKVSINSAEIQWNQNGKIEYVKTPSDTLVRYHFDELARLKSIKTGSTSPVLIGLNYNNFGKVKEYNVTTEGETFRLGYLYDLEDKVEVINHELGTLTFLYQGPLLSQINPYISKLDRDKYGNISRIKYQNYEVKLDISASGFLNSFDVSGIGEKVYYTRNRLIEYIEHNLTRDQTTLTKTLTYDNIHQLKESPELTGPFKRDVFGNLEHPDLVYVYPENTILETLEGKKVQYKSINEVLSVGSEYYLNIDLHYIEQHYVKYITADNRIVGALIKGPKINGFYGIVTDSRSSLRLILDENGEVLSARNYDAWGQLSPSSFVTNEGRLVDQLIRYDFAGMVRPFQSNYLVAKNRIYSPQRGTWCSLDPAILTSPDRILNDHLGELVGFTYAKNNPYSFIDPSGNLPILATGIVGGVIGGIVAGVGAIDSATPITDIAIGIATGFAAGTGGAFFASAATTAGGSALATYVGSATIGSSVNGLSQIAGSVISGRQFNAFEFGMTFAPSPGGRIGHTTAKYRIQIKLDPAQEIGLEWVNGLISIPNSILFDQYIKSQFDSDGSGGYNFNSNGDTFDSALGPQPYEFTLDPNIGSGLSRDIFITPTDRDFGERDVIERDIGNDLNETDVKR